MISVGVDTHRSNISFQNHRRSTVEALLLAFMIKVNEDRVPEPPPEPTCDYEEWHLVPPGELLNPPKDEKELTEDVFGERI